MKRAGCQSMILSLFVVMIVPGARAAAERASSPTSPIESRERVISPRVAGMLAAAAPKFAASPATATPDAAATAPVARERIAADGRPAPANGIVRLPDYVVRERKPAKLPEPEEVMSPRALEQIAMQRFLGDEQGLDRALSVLTPVHLWRKIPVLGKVPFGGFQTNEDRAMGMYRAAQIKERWEYLLSPEFKPTPAPPPAK